MEKFYSKNPSGFSRLASAFRLRISEKHLVFIRDAMRGYALGVPTKKLHTNPTNLNPNGSISTPMSSIL